MKKILLFCSLILSCYLSSAQTLTASPTTVESGSEVTFTAQNESVIGHIIAFGLASIPPTVTQVSISFVSGSDTYWSAFSPTVGSKFKCKFVNNTTTNQTVNVSVTGTVNNDNTGSQNTNWGSVIAITVKPPATTPTTYYNDAKSAVFYNNTCASGYGSDPYTYLVPANKYSSQISKADANNKAQADINANGQTKANQNTTCKLLYYNVAASQVFTPSCSVGYVSSSPTVTYTVAAGAYKSTISQADADSKAQAEIAANGQGYADGTCKFVYKSAAVTGNFTKNDCGTGYVGSTVTYTVPVGQFTSTVSQADANSQAQNYFNANAQAYANANGSCQQVVNASFDVVSTYPDPPSGSSTYFIIFINGTNVSGSRGTAPQNQHNTVAASGIIPNSNSTVVVQVTSGHMPTTPTLSGFWGLRNGTISGNTITFTGVNLTASSQGISLTFH
ncbi:DUF5977 domain-containing protein [Mucilaginibacter oryzae]|nr:DUF5977 domain-containing protein [Mucilaginibacter oryzae]